jgi:hypothetical protein
VVGVDSDDTSSLELRFRLSNLPKVKVSIAPREDTLGAKWNRCAEAAPADLYVIWADDITIATPGWDERLALAATSKFGGGPGCVFFGNITGTLQTGIAVTREWIASVGYFCPPFFPFWWCDTWLDELARLSGCFTQADVGAQLLQGIRGNSRGVRDVTFWGQFFQATRPWRLEAAAKLVEAGDGDASIFVRWPELIAQLDERDSPNRNPSRAHLMEQQLGFDAPADARYLRAKARAEAMLRELAGEPEPDDAYDPLRPGL